MFRKRYFKPHMAGLLSAIYVSTSVLTAVAPTAVLAAEDEEVIGAEEGNVVEEADGAGEENGIEETSGGEEATEAEETAGIEETSGDEETAESEEEATDEDTSGDDEEASIEEVSQDEEQVVDAAGEDEEAEAEEDVEDTAEEDAEGTAEGTIVFDGNSVSAPEDVTVEKDETTGMTKVSITGSTTYTLSGNGTNVYLSVDSVTAKIILDGIEIDNTDSDGAAFIEAAKKSKLTFSVSGTNTVKGGKGFLSQKKNSSASFTGSGTLNITESADDGIKSKGDIAIEECTINISGCGGDGIQGETVTIDSGSLDIATYYENAATGYYTKGTSSVAGYNTIWESGSVKTERVNVDTGSHTGIKTGTKAKTITFTTGDDDGAYSLEESSTASGGLVINGGTIKIDTTASGIKANKVSTDGYTVASTGVYIIGSPDDALSSNDYLKINGGTIEIAAGDDGITAAGEVTINGDSVVNITTAYEGIEGSHVVIGQSGSPEITINSNDDGINSTSKTLTYTYDSYEGYQADEDTGYYKKSESVTSGASVDIYGGSVKITIDSENEHSITLPDQGSEKKVSYRAAGDGIDCNGALDIEAGTVTVFGQSSGDNSPIDTNDGFTLGSDATVLATGVDGMNEARPEAGTGVYVSYGSSSMGGFGPGSGGTAPGSGGFGPGSDRTASGSDGFDPVTQGMDGQGTSSASISAGSQFTLSYGQEQLISTTLPYSASFLLYASPALTAGESYTAVTGSSSQTLTGMAAGSESTGGSGTNPPEIPGGEDGTNPPEIPGGEDGTNPLEVPGGEDGTNPLEVPGDEDGTNPPEVPGGEGEVSGQQAETVVVLPVKDKSLNVAEKLTPQGASKIRYVVSGNAVKVTKKGQVKAKKAGEAVISSQVKENGEWKETNLSIRIRVEAPSVTKKVSLTAGESVSVNSLIDRSTTSLSAGSISIKNTKIASADSSGKITALAKGSTRAIITIGTVKYKVKITVTDKAS